MYTAINWAMDAGLYAAVSALTCALWWLLGMRADRARLRGRPSRATSRDEAPGHASHDQLTVSKALPLIYRRSKRTGALLPREDNPNTPTTAEIPVVAAQASSMWRLPRALPLAWILYLAGLLIFTLLPIPSDPVAACAAIIHWDNYVPLGALAETAWRIRRARQAREDLPTDGGRLARSIPTRRVLVWIAIGALVSCLIEFTQYTGLFGVVPCTYRVVDIDDVITNTIGTYLGVRLLPLIARNARFMGA